MPRTLKICGTNTKPQLSLKGKWLSDLGFLSKKKVAIYESPGCLLIKINTAKSIYLHDITGYEHVKRALEVALVQEHFLSLIGREESTNPFIAWAHQYQLPAQNFKPCVCGNYMDPRKDCSCSPSEIRKHQLIIKKGDITLLVIAEKYQLSPAAPEKEDELLTRVSLAKENLHKIPKNLCADGKSLLKIAAERFNLDIACLRSKIDASSKLQKAFNCLLFISAFEVIFCSLNLLS